ncbi:hypothetical protein DYD21_05865 [Rhodohalobacter sp. SW132]|uniref:hypothetical protein n=1 Tax=Rhodohalobacter sp. SW132 TaxID=2293433 RepID=UPI000E2429EF|nr:hypothetical protein [Rhodohalobacter sp. SW132]REL38134.1 hypothetical protein DYD21_05865 [Rhodohalobacter sp. SW132]
MSRCIFFFDRQYRRTRIFIILFLILIPLSCSSVFDIEELSEAEPVPFEILRGSPMPYEDEESTSITRCRLNYSNIETSAGEAELIITSKDEFQTYIICNEDTQVDFNDSFLLAGTKGHHQCLLLYGQGLFLQDGTLVYRVEIREAACLVPTAASYIVKVPREYLRYPVEFDLFWGDWEEE